MGGEMWNENKNPEEVIGNYMHLLGDSSSNPCVNTHGFGSNELNPVSLQSHTLPHEVGRPGLNQQQNAAPVVDIEMSQHTTDVINPYMTSNILIGDSRRSMDISEYQRTDQISGNFIPGAASYQERPLFNPNTNTPTSHTIPPKLSTVLRMTDTLGQNTHSSGGYLTESLTISGGTEQQTEHPLGDCRYTSRMPDTSFRDCHFHPSQNTQGIKDIHKHYGMDMTGQTQFDFNKLGYTSQSQTKISQSMMSTKYDFDQQHMSSNWAGTEQTGDVLNINKTQVKCIGNEIGSPKSHTTDNYKYDNSLIGSDKVVSHTHGQTVFNDNVTSARQSTNLVHGCFQDNQYITNPTPSSTVAYTNPNQMDTDQLVCSYPQEVTRNTPYNITTPLPGVEPIDIPTSTHLALSNRQDSMTFINQFNDKEQSIKHGISQNTSMTTKTITPSAISVSPDLEVNELPKYKQVASSGLMEPIKSEDNQESLHLNIGTMMSDEPDDDPKRISRRRERNRIAAQKCRQKKRDAAKGLVEQYQDLESSNTQLKYEIRQYKKQRTDLQRVLTEHLPDCKLKSAKASTSIKSQDGVTVSTETKPFPVHLHEANSSQSCRSVDSVLQDKNTQAKAATTSQPLVSFGSKQSTNDIQRSTTSLSKPTTGQSLQGYPKPTTEQSLQGYHKNLSKIPLTIPKPELKSHVVNAPIHTLSTGDVITIDPPPFQTYCSSKQPEMTLDKSEQSLLHRTVHVSTQNFLKSTTVTPSGYTQSKQTLKGQRDDMHKTNSASGYSNLLPRPSFTSHMEFSSTNHPKPTLHQCLTDTQKSGTVSVPEQLQQTTALNVQNQGTGPFRGVDSHTSSVFNTNRVSMLSHGNNTGSDSNVLSISNSDAAIAPILPDFLIEGKGAANHLISHPPRGIQQVNRSSHQQFTTLSSELFNERYSLDENKQEDNL